MHSQKSDRIADSGKNIAKLSETRSPRSLDPAVLELGGFGILAYSLFSLIRALAANQALTNPEVGLAVMSELVSLSPILLLGPVLIFTAQGASQAKGLAKKFARWLVLLLAILFFLFIPLSFFQKFILTQLDANQALRYEASLLNRKQAILAAIQDLKSPAEFQQRLSAFPEIRQTKPIPLQSPASLRQEISDALDRAIKGQLSRLETRQQQRMSNLNSVVVNILIGSMITGSTFFMFASLLFPWLKASLKSLARSCNIFFGKGKTPFGRSQFSRFFLTLGLRQPRSGRRR